MKNLYPAALALLTTSAAAQLNRPLLPIHPEEKHGHHQPAQPNPNAGGMKGSGYYSEPFETGLNGWSVQNIDGDVPWAWTDIGPGPTTSTYPVPPLSTTTGGWMMVDDDYLGTSGVDSETWLISPVIDLSAAPTNLKLEFEQYFQEWQNDHTFVGVSTDGGSTWSEEEVNEGVGRDGRPNPELMDVNISAWVEMDPANVQIRFRYVGQWDYGWEVDNIRIVDLPNNDMALLLVNRTTFDATTATGIPYTMVPAEHITNMDMFVQHKNKGFLEQTNVVASVVVTGPGGQEFTSSAPAVSTMAPTEVSDGFFDTYTPSGDVGTYTVDFNLTQNETDDEPSNNTRQQTFQVTPGTYAVDGGVVTNLVRQVASRRDMNFEVGSLFELVNDDAAIAVQVAVHEDTPVGGTIYGAVYTPSTQLNVPPDLIEATEDHVINAGDLNGIGGSTFITLPFANPVDLSGGTIFQVMAGEYDAVDSLRFATGGFIPSQVSTIFYPNATDSIELVLNKAPMVRLVLASGGVGIIEHDGSVTVVNAVPNPFEQSTDLRFDLLRAGRVRVELHDALGRLVRSEDLGQLSAGEQRYTLEGSGLSDGVYTYSVITDDAVRTGKLVRRAR
jgi:hypothetical protein